MRENKKRVLLITDSLSLGGAERQLLLLAKNLPEQWEPAVIALTPGPMIEKYNAAGIQIHIIKRICRFDAFSPLFRILRLIQKIEPDLVHSWGWMSTIASSIGLLGTEVPQISGVIRMGNLPVRRKWFTRYAASLGKLTIANSQSGLKSWNIPSKRGRVVHNGFDWSRLKNRETKHKYIDNPFTVLMTATMSNLKDWKNYIATARYIANNYNNYSIKFIGYGDGPLRNEILKDAEDLINRGNIHLPGRTNDSITTCFQANVGVLLSPHGEGISNSIMEYMACGLPVICTRAGGNTEIVVDGTTGFLVAPENSPEEIAEKILWLQNNPKKAREMGEAGQIRIRTNFSLDKMVSDFVSIYENVLK